MSLFELTAKSQMYLGDGNIVKKGEKITMDIHTPNAQPYNLFSNPENRRQAIQQFAVHGIDAKPGANVLSIGNWDVKKMPSQTFSRTIENSNMENFEKFHFPWQDVPQQKFIDDVDMKKGCMVLVKDFYKDGKDVDFIEDGLEGRLETAFSFYDGIKKEMGIDAKLCFDPTMAPNDLGGFEPSENVIRLNANYLENPDCKGLLNTMLHESRHAFEKRCVDNPKSCTISDNVLAAWKENFDHYIKPEYDFVAYENQEIEKDANYFADSVMKYGIENAQYA